MGKKSTTTQKSESAPWKPIQPYLQDLADEAPAYFDQPVGYGPSVATPWNSIQQSGFDQLAQLYGGQVPGTQGIQNTLVDASSGAFTGSRGDAPLLDAAYGGAANPWQGFFGAGAIGARAPQVGDAQLASVARGEYLTPDSNPYLRGSFDAAAKAVTDQFQRAVMPGINANFSLAGRGARAGEPGSGAYYSAVDFAQDNLANNLGNLAQQYYGNAYGQERGLQQSAIADINTNNLARGAQAAQYGSLGAQAFSDDVTRQLAAAGQVGEFDRGDYNRTINAALSSYPTLQQSYLGMAPNLFGLGGAQQAQDERLAAEEADRYRYEATEERQRFLQELQTAMALGGQGGTTVNSQQQRNPLGGLQAAAGIASLALPFFAGPAAAAPAAASIPWQQAVLAGPGGGGTQPFGLFGF